MNVKVCVVSSIGEDIVVCPRYALHPYQRQVRRDILYALSSADRRVVAHLPTGAGKTRIASHIACDLLNKQDEDDALAIWLASTEELCDQAANEFTQAWYYLGFRDVSIHRYWGSRSLDLRRLSSGFLVMGLSKLRFLAFQDNTILAHLAHRAVLVIFDEAHQAVARTYSFITEQLCSCRPPLLGLTATPGRTAHFTDADYHLAEMFNYNKVSIDARGYDSPITYLIAHGYLADPDFQQVIFESRAEIPDPKPGIDYSTDDLEELGDNRERTYKIVDLARQAVQRHPRTIIFCPSVWSAEECHRLLRAVGVCCDVITANTPSKDRQAVLENFKRQTEENRIICNYGVLTAGFDAPLTRCVIIARPTTSLVLYSQMVGRALRGPRAGGNIKAQILTVVDTNLPGFGSVTDAFKNWEELWTKDL